MSSSRSPDLWDPISWWGHTWRVLLAAVTGLLMLGLALDHTVSRAVAPWLYYRDIVVGLASLVLLPLHRRFPVVVPLLLQAATATSASATGSASIALVSVATRRRWGHIAVTTAVGVAATLYGMGTYPPAGESTPEVDIGVIVLATLAQVAWGLYIGARRDLVATWRWRAENAEQEQVRRAEAAKLDERSRIAREMHDVLAHRISLVSMHAGALAYRADLSPSEVRAEAEIIQRTSTEALTELRAILGVLRSTPVGGTEESVAAPQPTFADLADLVGEAREAGLPVTFVDELPAGVGPSNAVGRHAYRMVQEALTNVRKHAPGAATEVRLRGRPGSGLTVEVRNRAPALWRPAAPAIPGAGLGLLGLAERASIVGGSLEHGAQADGGYLVTARLPWPKESP